MLADKPVEKEMPNPEKSSRTYIRLTMFVLVLLVVSCVAIFVALVGHDLWTEISRTPSVLSQPRPSLSVSDKEEIIATEIDAYNKRAEDLEKLISFLIGLSVLYTLALGATSYLSLQHAFQRAQGTVNEMEAIRSKTQAELEKSTGHAAEKAAEVVREIRDEFPLFGYMDVSIRRITKNLLALLPFLGWSDDLYEKLSEQQKQEILFYEKTVAGLEFFDLRTIRKDVSKIFDGLGNFYALKKKYEGSHSLPADLERCQFYLDRARKVDQENIAAWNDTAFVALVLESPMNLQKVRDCCTNSLRIDPNQQRARYNLAIAEHISENFPIAESLLTEALNLERWQEKHYPPRMHNLYYNRACARSRMAGAEDISRPDREKLLEEALTDIHKAFEEPKFWDKEDRATLANDAKAGGDIHLLAEKFAVEIQRLLSSLNEAS